MHVNSPSVFNGYISGETKHQSLYNNWLNTGDVGFWDSFGELHIVGRIDDVLIVGGHKIYPFEVEKLIQSIANVDECVVTLVSINDEDKLCCLYSSETEIGWDLIQRLGEVLIKHEIPKVFIKTDKIPRNTNGKIMMHSVKEILLNELIRRKESEFGIYKR